MVKIRDTRPISAPDAHLGLAPTEAIKKKRRRERRDRLRSWESHDARRARDYEGEMEHAFQHWHGIALCDLKDGDEKFYVPIDPDPDACALSSHPPLHRWLPLTAAPCVVRSGLRVILLRLLLKRLFVIRRYQIERVVLCSSSTVESPTDVVF